MGKKPQKLFGKIVMVLFMAMIVVGFTIPGFLQNSDNSDTYADEEQRICQTDPECYLDCGTEPVAVMCFQNLCQRNSCDGADYYPLTDATTFTLHVILNGEAVRLENYANTQNLFFAFEENTVRSFTDGAAIRHVLDTLGMAMDTQCIQALGQNFCTGDGGELMVTVNGEQNFAGEYLIPAEGDVIEILFA
jgi:hypothetical protein